MELVLNDLLWTRHELKCRAVCSAVCSWCFPAEFEHFLQTSTHNKLLSMSVTAGNFFVLAFWFSLGI